MTPCAAADICSIGGTELPLTGRIRESDLIRELVPEGSSRGAALLVVEDPGIRKTWLLAEDSSGGHRRVMSA